MKFVVAERDGLFYVAEISRVDMGRDLDGRRVVQDKVVLRGDGDWLKKAVEQRVVELNQQYAA